MNNRSKYIFVIIIFVTCLLVTSFLSCQHEPVLLGEIDTVCFKEQVLPILQASCGISGCHDNSTASEEFVATSYESIMKAVKPGDARGSLLYKVITDINAEHFMPPGRPLAQQQRTLIHLWIAQGAKNTKCSYDSTNGGNGNINNLDTVCFNQDILPVLLSSCGLSGCHDAASHAEGYVLTSYSTLMQNSEGIVAFNPGQSKIYEVITETEAEDRMPPLPNDALSSSQIELFYTWITEGAIDSDCPQKACDTAGTIAFSTQVWPVINNNCTGCHNSSNSRGGVNLDGYLEIKYYAETLQNGTPILVGVINYMNGFANMPPSGKLDGCSIRKIELWIDQGIADN
jgi:hypothetical protein